MLRASSQPSRAAGAHPPKSSKCVAAEWKKECAHCGTRLEPETTKTCAKCRETTYCGKECQVAHWKGGHKGFCVRPEQRRPGLAAEGEEGSDGEKCAICLSKMDAAAVTLPCRHSFHKTCIDTLRKYDDKCPFCKGVLPTRGSLSLVSKAHQGECMAQFLVALCCDPATTMNIDGVEKNPDAAFGWYLKAAQQGHFEAMHNVGFCLENGCGVEKDCSLAAEWYVRARSDMSLFNLGLLYKKGHGVPQSFAKFLSLVTEAGQNGFIPAQKTLAELYKNGGPDLPRDEAESLKWYKKAARGGDAVSMYNLGVIYEGNAGIEVRQNFEESFRWYLKATENGYSKARHHLAVLYHRGLGVKRNGTMARLLYEQGAREGICESIRNLGILYLEGKAFDDSESKDEGDAEVFVWRDNLDDLEMAISFFQEAADTYEDLPSMWNLAVCYQQIETKVFQDRAAYWFERCKEEGFDGSDFDGIMKKWVV
jgi:TPR repeat protein